MRPMSPKAKELAQRLIESETHTGPDSFLLIFEKLRTALTSLVGNAGVEALFSRAFALAKVEVAWLGRGSIGAEGTLNRLREVAFSQSPEQLLRGHAELLNQFMGLLITFIGEDLTVQIIQDAWIDSLPLPQNLSTEEISE